MNTHKTTREPGVGTMFRALPRDQRLLLLDLALAVTALLMAFGPAMVFFFHVLFLLLALGAFYWNFRAFAMRAGLWVTLTTIVVLAAIISGETQTEELSEIPLLAAILLLVFAIARQRSKAEEALRKTNEELENRVAERTADLTTVNAELVDEIARRQQTEETLRDSEERYRHLVQLSFEAVAIHTDGLIVYINPAGAKLLGASDPKELIGKPIIDFVHPEFWELVSGRLEQVGETRKGVPLIEERFVRLDGTIVDVEAAAVPVIYQGKPAIQVVIHDITPRKQAEMEREKERARIARDLHDSLGHNLGFLHLKLDQLAGSEVSEEAIELQKSLEQMRDVADDAYEIVRDMLAAALPSNTADLATALLVRARAVGRRGKFQIRLASEGRSCTLSPVVQQQVLYLFQEALTNIERHAEAQQVDLHLEWQEDNLTITLVDDGRGFQPADLQLNGKFGLWIMRERAEEMNGRLELSSHPNGGTEVRLRLPLDRGQRGNNR